MGRARLTGSPDYRLPNADHCNRSREPLQDTTKPEPSEDAAAAATGEEDWRRHRRVEMGVWW